MTREEKIEWLAQASNEEVINQMRWTVTAMVSSTSLELQIQANEDYELVTAELRKRLG